MPKLHYFLLLAFLSLAPLRYGTATDLKLGVENLNYLPYFSVDQDQYQGYARELFDAFAAAQGLSIHYRPLPVERLYRELLSGAIDCKFPDNPTWRHDLKSKQDALRYSLPIAPFKDAVMAPPESGADNSESALRIGTIRGFTPWPLMHDIEQGRILLSENNSLTGLLRQAITGRLDGVYINVDVARYHLTHLLKQPNALTPDETLPYNQCSYHVSCLHQSKLIDQLDLWLNDNQLLIWELRKKWGIRE